MNGYEFEEILRKYPTCVWERRKLLGLLKDYFPDDPLKTNLIMMAFDVNVVPELERVQTISQSLKNTLVDRMTQRFGVNKTDAVETVELWCQRYGIHILGKELARTNTASKRESAGTSYGELFSYEMSSRGDGWAVNGFHGENESMIVFQNRFQNRPVVEIKAESFFGSSIETAVLAEGFLRIGAYAFENSRLKSILCPTSVREWGEGVFSRCRFLERIDLSIQKLQQIPDKAFLDCVGLQSVILPKSLNTIGDHAFKGCTSLKQLRIPDGVINIGEHAFDHMSEDFVLMCSMDSYTIEYAKKYHIPYQVC